VATCLDRLPGSALHGELGELVRAGQPLERAVDGTSTVKHLVEELGIPHTEYGEVRVNGVPFHGGHRVPAAGHEEVPTAVLVTR
jgi:hypothetical protein